jgi:hypothetical protein
MRNGVLFAAAAALLGCDDEIRLVQCVDQAEGFDIEEVSALETAHAVAGGADAIILERGPDDFPTEGDWRVGSVEVLVAVPERELGNYPAGVALTVQVWDDDKPTQKRPYELTQRLDEADLSWERASIVEDPNDPFARPVAFRKAWWKFDLTDVIAPGEMTSARYLVGVKWTSGSRPAIGASNFNRPCQLNWTDYADGRGWVLNGTTSGNRCSWPMLRVGAQVVTARAACN